MGFGQHYCQDVPTTPWAVDGAGIGELQRIHEPVAVARIRAGTPHRAGFLPRKAAS